MFFNVRNSIYKMFQVCGNTLSGITQFMGLLSVGIVPRILLTYCLFVLIIEPVDTCYQCNSCQAQRAGYTE